MNLKSYIFILCIFLSYTHVCLAENNTEKTIPPNAGNYLSRPTGRYGVGFEDFHWISQNNRPDPFYNGKNKDDFSPENKKHCREIMARIYYPTASQNQPGSFYYQPLIKNMQEKIKQNIPNIPHQQLEQLNQIRSYSIEKSPIVADKIFPVLIFSPGFGWPVETYENLISELVSQGYIVIGINSLFLSGDVALPNGHVVKPASARSTDDIEKKFVPVQAQDLSFAFEQIDTLHHSNAIFSAMDLKHVGAFGHSIGGRLIADIAHVDPSRLQAAVTLDTAIDPSGKSLKKFSIPFMHEISANRISASPIPVTFELGNNGYLVGLAPNENDHDYSYHMNFSDLSTLQYLPAFQTLANSLKQKAEEKFDLKLMLHNPTKRERNKYSQSTYVLIKTAGTWRLEYFKDRKKVNELDIIRVQGLDTALASLPKKSPELLSPSEIEPIRAAILSFKVGMGKSFGTGDGWELTNSINANLVQFFNTFLKDQQNPAFKNCMPLSKNTFMKCGSATNQA